MREQWHHIDLALERLFVAPDPSLEACLRRSAEAGLPEIAVSPNLGKLLTLMVRISGARRVLEIGTLGGYSTIWLAKGLPADGHITSLELEESHAAVARENLKAAGFDHLTNIRVGPASETLRAFQSEEAEPYDLIFLDADKKGYPDYLAASLELSRPGTLIIADNIVKGGAVFDETESDPDLDGLRTFLKDVADNPLLDAAGIQTVGSKGYDGLAIARVVEHE
ncbi:MAG: O-methyltransferase [Rhodothermales bacterium]|nr:O-methyltransferase [Rhodothermales bacterium]MBO6780840.1 O-methyltransferase [Rhodothermales bacterium]